MFAGVASISLGLPVPGVTGNCVVLQCYCPTVYELTSTTLCTVCMYRRARNFHKVYILRSSRFD